MVRILLAVALLVATVAIAADKPSLPLAFEDDFSRGADRWKPTDPTAWKVIDTKDGKAYSQFRQSKYQPKYRSPFNYAVVKDVVVSDLVLDVTLRSTCRDYPHRDLCLVFGWQSPDRFYYVHLGKRTDDHANQIFIVNDAARTKISTKTTAGTPWTDGWHRVRIVRTVADGRIAVYFDDMTKPVMTATDRTFRWGQVGVGSFDDTGDFRVVQLHGKPAKKE
ncbi:MAG: hypothetical protein U0736_05620 [Gemmataceae bacterium]